MVVYIYFFFIVSRTHVECRQPEPHTPQQYHNSISKTGVHIGLNAGSRNSVHPSIPMHAHYLSHLYRNCLKSVIHTECWQPEPQAPQYESRLYLAIPNCTTRKIKACEQGEALLEPDMTKYQNPQLTGVLLTRIFLFL